MVNKLVPKVRDLRQFGAAATEICLAAMGGVDRYVMSSLCEWDCAAGGLIAEESGCVVSGRTMEVHMSGDMVVVAGPCLHSALLAVLAECNDGS